MRTTLTLDDDIAMQLTQLREKRKMSLRDVVNMAMRAGLIQMTNPESAKKRICKTPVYHATRSLIGDIASTADMLAVAEGEDYR